MWLVDYDGDNNAARRLELELAGYDCTIVDIPGRMLADADFFSRLSQDLHFDPLLKDCVICSRNLHKEASPSTGQVTTDNLSGRRNRKIIAHIVISFANVIYNEEHTIILDGENLEDYKFDETPSSILQFLAQHIPVLITATEHIQPQSRFNLSFIAKI